MKVARPSYFLYPLLSTSHHHNHFHAVDALLYLLSITTDTNCPVQTDGVWRAEVS